MILTNTLKRRLHSYFKKRLGMYDYRRGWMKGDCPYCGEHKFGVNLGQNRSNCFKCASHPDLISIVQDVENLVNISEAKTFILGFEELEYFEETVEAFQLKENVSLPDGYKNIRRGKSVLAKTARRYLEGRGFDLQRLSRAGWGYCNKDKYFGYIIMPFYMEGKLVYFNARRFIGTGPKFNNPLVEDFGIGKSMLIYNRDSLFIYKKIFLVESVTNSETIGGNSVAIGGKKISDYQMNYIIKSPVEKIVIGLDRDGILDAINIGLKIVNYKKVKIIEFEDDRDINDLGRKPTLIKSYKSNYLDYNGLLKLKNIYS